MAKTQWGPAGGYRWMGEILKVTDGDTVKIKYNMNAKVYLADRDLGFHQYVENHQLVWHWPTRLARINAPEHNTSDGIQAFLALKAFLPIGQKIEVRTRIDKMDETDLYERVLGEIYRIKPDGTTEIRSASQFMLDGGWAMPYFGRGARPLPSSPVPVAPVRVPYEGS